MSDIEVFSRIDAAEAAWRGLEQDAAASPFQRFDWAAPYLRHVEPANGAQTVIALLRGAGGAPAALLALEKTRRRGITILRSLGGKHASFHLPLATAEGLALLAADPAGVLRGVASAAGGADLVILSHQPQSWNGMPNAFLGSGSIAMASSAYETSLGEDAETFIRDKTSGDARKKLRKKRQSLTKIGEVASIRPSDGGQITATLDAFLAQKQRRFAALGVANPFAEPAIIAFLREATAPRTDEQPAIELHALTCAGRIVAVFGLAIGWSRASGMFTSFEDDPGIARCSPGDILLHDMVTDLISRKFAYFDLGVGEARYKNAFCDTRIGLFETLMPLTLYGRLAAAAIETASRMKATVKRDPRLAGAAQRLRAALKRSA